MLSRPHLLYRGNGIIALPQSTRTSSEDSFDSNPVDLRVIKRSHHNPQPGAKAGEARPELLVHSRNNLLPVVIHAALTTWLEAGK